MAAGAGAAETARVGGGQPEQGARKERGGATAGSPRLPRRKSRTGASCELHFVEHLRVDLVDVELALSDFARTLAHCRDEVRIVDEPLHRFNQRFNGAWRYEEAVFSLDHRFTTARSVRRDDRACHCHGFEDAPWGSLPVARKYVNVT